MGVPMYISCIFSEDFVIGTPSYNTFLHDHLLNNAPGNASATGNHSSANIYLFKVNSKNSRKRCEICSKLTVTNWATSVT